MTAEQVLTAARTRGWCIAVAESCTGGLLAGALTEIPGSSDVFERGFVTYSNAAKIDLLGVAEATLADHGAVSEPVALEMARGALSRAPVHLTLSITGIAGPGGSPAKPEGMVCFGVASATGAAAQTRQFGPIGRGRVRQASVDHALALLLEALGAETAA